MYRVLLVLWGVASLGFAAFYGLGLYSGQPDLRPSTVSLGMHVATGIIAFWLAWTYRPKRR